MTYEPSQSDKTINKEKGVLFRLFEEDSVVDELYTIIQNKPKTSKKSTSKMVEEEPKITDFEKKMNQIAKLKKIFKVSDSIEISQIAFLLNIDKKELMEKLIDWADVYGFRIKNEQLIIEGGKVDAFIAAELDSTQLQENATKPQIHPPAPTKQNVSTEPVVALRGQKLVKSEYDAMVELERTTSPIPFVSEIKNDTFGVLLKDNHVVGLSLYNKNIKSLPESIGNLKNMQTLNVSGNQLTALPESIGNLKNMQTLNVSGNQLTALPESLGTLTNLQILDVNKNQLTALPEWLGNLTNLQTLDVKWNRLTALPESIKNLTNLQTLDVSWNQLTALPESIKNLTNLQTLDVIGNKLTALPEWLGNLKSLKYLLIGKTQMEKLDFRSYDLLAKLKKNGIKMKY